jgi:hypothetical protein
MAQVDQAALAPPVEGEPSSNETCGRFPAQEVAQTFPGTGTDPQAADAAPARAAAK